MRAIGYGLGVIGGIFYTLYVKCVMPFFITPLGLIKSTRSGMLYVRPRIFAFMCSPTSETLLPLQLIDLARNYPHEASIVVSIRQIYTEPNPNMRLERRRMLTIMAALQGFALPRDVVLLDDGTKRLWTLYRRHMSLMLPTREDLAIEMSRVRTSPTEEDYRRAERLAIRAPLILQLLLRYGKNDCFPLWARFYPTFIQAARTNKLLFTSDDVESLVTAVAMRYAVKIPRSFLRYDVMTVALMNLVVGENPAAEGNGKPTLSIVK